MLDSDGTGNAFLIAEAVQYAAKNGADVINMSLGSSQESKLVQDVADDLDVDDDGEDSTGRALEVVPAEGAVVVASAGNESTIEPRYPAAEAGVLSVASVGKDSVKSDFSNYGDVDVSAPGDDIYSTFPTDRYAQWDGTSMAAPFVAGQAALIRSLEPNMESSLVDDTIIKTARDINSVPGNQNQLYSGKIGGHADAFRAIQEIRKTATCTAPTISAVSPVPGSATRDTTPLIGATVRDAETANLTRSNVALYLDERRVYTYYNTNTDRATAATRTLSYGRHVVRLTAQDPQGLSRTRYWAFSVVR